MRIVKYINLNKNSKYLHFDTHFYKNHDFLKSPVGTLVTNARWQVTDLSAELNF